MRTFIKSKYSLLLFLIIINIPLHLESLFGYAIPSSFFERIITDDNRMHYYAIDFYVALFYQLFFYWMIGMFLYPKIEDKKSAATIVIVVKWVFSIILFFIYPFSLDYYYTNNPIAWLILRKSNSQWGGLIVSSLTIPLSILLIILFSKTPLLFKFLKRIRIKKSEKRITFYLKDVETKQ